MQPYQCLIGIVSYTGRVPQQEQQKNKRIRRQFSRLLQHLIKGEVVEINEMNSISQRLRGLAESFGPILFERSCADHNGDVLRSRRDVEHVIQQARDVENLADVGR